MNFWTLGFWATGFWEAGFWVEQPIGSGIANRDLSFSATGGRLSVSAIQSHSLAVSGTGQDVTFNATLKKSTVNAIIRPRNVQVSNRRSTITRTGRRFT